MLRLLAILVILIVIIGLVINMSEERKPQRSAPPMSVPVQTPAATPAAQPASAPVGQANDKFNQIYALAQQQRVQVQLQPSANGAVAQVSWGGDVATLGGDFLQALMTQGIVRDFSPAQGPDGQSQGIQHDASGQRVWFAYYDLRF